MFEAQVFGSISRTHVFPHSAHVCQLNLRRESNSVWTVVVEEEVSGQLVACGSIFIELKFTHGCGMVGHIEDIVVSRYRLRNFAVMMCHAR